MNAQFALMQQFDAGGGRCCIVTWGPGIAGDVAFQGLKRVVQRTSSPQTARSAVLSCLCVRARCERATHSVHYGGV